MSIVVPPTAELYGRFEKTVMEMGEETWMLGVFEGSPTASAYSWCSDCVAASEDLRRFLRDYKGKVKVMQFKVGNKREWEGPDGGQNPFRVRFPHLSDLPTAVLFRGGVDVARVIQPRKDDLKFLARRARVFEEQIRSGSWHVPRPRWSSAPSVVGIAASGRK